LECAYMAKELAQLEGKHFSKMYLIGESAFRLKIGDLQVIAQVPDRLSLAKYIPKAGEQNGFVQNASRILDNQRLLKVRQFGNDRIIVFEFDKSIVYFELFAKGNIVVADTEGKIALALREEKWKDREIGRGRQYKPPPSSFCSNVQEALSEKYAIVCLLRLPLGKDYAKDMLERCSIEERKPGNSLSKAEVECLEKKHNEILEGAKPYLFLEDGKPADYGLAKLRKYSHLEAREIPSLSEAMEEYYANAPEKKKNEKMEKLKRRLEEQISTRETLKQREKEAKEKGDYIYANYQQVEEALAKAKKGGINDVEAALKGYNIISIDRKKKEVELEF
ncbi:MAG: NFACT family protein, partial [Candidatus ainarchaeum sp.]|nr:NFACT family protein [Candidatus ainarchaeum sp.]